jgi:hypothetical protein
MIRARPKLRTTGPTDSVVQKSFPKGSSGSEIMNQALAWTATRGRERWLHTWRWRCPLEDWTYSSMKVSESSLGMLGGNPGSLL